MNAEVQSLEIHILDRHGASLCPHRQLPALGQCLATLAGAMPVAFLEPMLNMYNPFSVFTTKSCRERASKSQVVPSLQLF